MLGLKFQRAEKYIPQLHSDRVIATQIKRNEDNQIISRTFHVYEFEDNFNVKIMDGPPPYWTGIIPGDPSTYTNPITDPINYHYKVRIPYTLTEYTGYLMYAQPIENIEELELPPDFINPNDVNLYKGWFKREIDAFSYDYFLPLRTGVEFRWEIERIVIDRNVPTFYVPNRRILSNSVGTYPSDSFNDDLNERVKSYRDQGYTVTISQNNSKLNYSSQIIATKNIYNLGGVRLSSYSLLTNRAVFEIQENNCAIGIKFKIKNCKVYLSNSISGPNTVVFMRHLGTHYYQTVVTIEQLKTYKYIIVEPNLKFQENTIVSLDGITSISVWNPLKFNVPDNTGFSFIAEFIGRHYLHYKEDIDDVSLPELVPSPHFSSVNFNDPKPSGVKIEEYEFIDEDSPNYWDANIVGCKS